MSGPARRSVERRIDGVPEARLHAYHDGELSRLARWRLERRLRRSPALRRALGEIERVGAWVRTAHRATAGPDLWDAIARGLPAVDATRPGASARGAFPGLAWLAWPGAVAATAAIAVAILFGRPVGEEPAAEGVVRWLDSGGRNVMVLESASDTTIVWVFSDLGAGSAGGGRDEI